MGKRGQISVEYLIVVSFVVFIVTGMLAIAFYYAASVRDEIRVSQLTNFANKIISSSESVFYAGEPSKLTINAYLPEGVRELYLIGDGPVLTDLFVEIELSSGRSVVIYESEIPLQIPGNPSGISLNEGLKKLEITALSPPNNVVEIREVA